MQKENVWKGRTNQVVRKENLLTVLELVWKLKAEEMFCLVEELKAEKDWQLQLVENSSFCVLKSSKDFERLKLKGSKVFLEKKILVSYLKNNLDNHRVGWTLPRAVGNAVLRNRLKRYSREFFRTYNQNVSKSNLDVNLVFLKSGSLHFKKMDYNDFTKLLLPCWQKITNS